jgi:hypothetical protein
MITWDAIARRDFTDWQGLPDDASYADFGARFPRLVDAEAVGLLGSQRVSARYRVHVADGYPQNLRAWYIGPRLVLVEASLPQLAGSTSDLLDGLGEPTTTIDFAWDVLTVPSGGHIHAERGISLFLGPESQVLRLSLYAPTDADGYLATLHHETALVERPLREPDP